MKEPLERASDLWKDGKLDEALELLEKILEAEAGNVAALHALGMVLTERGDYQRAAEAIRRVVAMRPTAPAYHVHLAEAYRGLGDFKRVVGSCRTALMLRPDFPEALCTMGLALHGMGRHSEAAEEFRRALSLRPNMPAAHNNLGIVLKEAGATDEAIAHFRIAVELAPDLNRARVNLGMALLEMRQAEEALVHLREAARIEPDLPALHVNIGNALRALSRLDDARDAYLEALRLNPELPYPNIHIGATLREEGRLEEAVPWYKNAVALSPDNPAFWEHLAGLYDEREDPEEAVICWEQALLLSPSERAATHIGLGAALQDSGRPSEAREHFIAAIQLRPDLAAARLHLGGNHEVMGAMAEAEFRAALRLQPDFAIPLARLGTLLRDKLPERDLRLLEDRLADPMLAQGPRARLLFALAHVLDAGRDYEGAARCLREANSLARELAGARRPYSPDEHEEWVSGLLEVFSREFFARAAGWGHGSRRPVFVFGMPRSGTTLVEQVLASHPLVYGAGELRLGRQSFCAIPSVLGRADSPRQCVPHLDEAAVQRLATMHLAKLDALDGGGASIVDKMPDNYAHLGLLAALFPNAVFIHCRRDLRDVAVSCWMTDFGSIRWAWDPGSITARLRQYGRLMEHWQAVLPVTMHEVHYEETVSNLEGVARGLVAVCGLDWDGSCLEFRRTQRPVRTASVTQVRQQIYTKAVARWKNYKNYLSELLGALPAHPGGGPGTPPRGDCGR